MPWSLRRLIIGRPFETFFTATPRGGSEPAEAIEIFGVASDPKTLRSARIEIAKR